ncbi:glutathione S-transferase family protein [Azospirillum sp.]|uniref:glutathione S-transferase family protein n=1 Tax=Azospirillum sp. TaxID=34012 RepID=UPI003D74A670
MPPVVLHGPAMSSYVWSARIALAEKGVEHTLNDMPFGAHKLPDHLARHPFGKVPAFEHDGFALYETQAIVRYVDEAFAGPALQPADARQRARMNQVMGVLDSYGWPSCAGGIMFQRLIAPKMGLPTNEAAVEAALPMARICYAEWERLLGDQPFMAGDAFSLADVMMAPMVIYSAMTPETRAMMAEAPRLYAWGKRMAERPSVARTSPLPPRA